MAILKIARMGHPVLARKADSVDDPTAPEVALLVRDMVETMQDAGGIGLAAPQVHIPKRVVIFFVPPERAEDKGVPLTVLINPEIEFLTDDREVGTEGCLSVPGMSGEVPRYTKIRYSADQLDGSRLVREAENYHARVVQHECDHLDGVLYPMRMEDLSSFGYNEERQKAEIERQRNEVENDG